MADTRVEPDPGLCATCTHMRAVRSAREQVFYRCGKSDTDPHFPRYPVIPVCRCEGYVAIESVRERPIPEV